MNAKTKTIRTIIIAVATAFAAGALIALGLITGGVVTFKRADSVPCNSLTTYAQVQSAMTDHADVVSRLKSAGKGVAVEPVRANCPTSGEPLGYVRVTYANDAERDAVQGVLTGDGLGVYVTLDKQ